MPRPRDRDEEAENQNLQHQAPENDVLPALDAVVVAGLDEHARAAGLHEEAEDVARDEELGEPVGADDRVGCGVGAEDEAAEDHVDGCGEEDWCDEDENGLDDVWGFGL